MELRKELKPNLEVVRELYPVVKKEILDFTDFWDNNPDEAVSRHKEVEAKLHKLTGKDMTPFDLWEYWEADGVENLAFRISLPDPIKVTDITKDELKQLLVEVKVFESPSAYEDDEILLLFWAHKTEYYRSLIKASFDSFADKYFDNQKGKDGVYFEYSVEQALEGLWG